MIAAIYARKSTEQNVVDDQKSTRRQIEHAREYAARKGWAVSEDHIFDDDGISGAEFAKRPGFLRLMNALGRRAPFQVLIVSELSRLGREQFETNFALKKLAEAGVRTFAYMDDREVILDSAVDRFLLAAVNFGAELEREKASLRSHDKARQQFLAGHVTGGVVFGYDNVKVSASDGRHSHVERRVNDEEAAVVRRIFELRAAGVGQVRIARALNTEGARAPQPRGDGRARGWAASTVREILFREMYRGRLVWNRQRKRTAWGREQHTDRPTGEWLHRDAPALRIVSDVLWHEAHRQLARDRHEYDRVTGGKRQGRKDRDSKYLLVGFARCGVCGGGMHVRTRSTTKGRRTFFYACTNHYNKQACSHQEVWPLEAIDQAVLMAIGGDVLQPEAIEDVVKAARAMFDASQADDQTAVLQCELEQLETEQARVADAIANGGRFPVLMAKLEATERRRKELTALLVKDAPAPQPPSWREIERRVRQSLTDWRALLLGDVAHARDAFRKLLSGAIRFTPFDAECGRGVRFDGRIGLEAVLGGSVVTNGMTWAGIEPATL